MELTIRVLRFRLNKEAEMVRGFGTTTGFDKGFSSLYISIGQT